MTDDVIALNHGGATHIGARAVVHPGVETAGGRLELHRVVEDLGGYMVLSDGNTYCKRTGGPKGYYGHPTVRHRVALTEGNPMYESWAKLACAPRENPQLPHRTGSTAVTRRTSRLRRLISIG